MKYKLIRRQAFAKLWDLLEYQIIPQLNNDVVRDIWRETGEAMRKQLDNCLIDEIEFGIGKDRG